MEGSSSVKGRKATADTQSGGKIKQRYQLRSASKAKDEKGSSPKEATLNSSAIRRGRPPSSVSKSMNVLDLSGKEKTAKPPRRLSIPNKSNVSPVARTPSNMTPISEIRSRRTGNGQGKCDTPGSDISRSGMRPKFSILASASYWLNQIKLSESAAKHSISLGFFKLAVEAGCEPLQRMRDELKSYVRKHKLNELGESVKELFDSYSISDSVEQMQVSETVSQGPDAGTKSSDDETSSNSGIGSGNLKPKSLDTDVVQASSVTRSAKKTNIQNNAPARARGPTNKRSLMSKSVTESGTHNLPKKKSGNSNKMDEKKEKAEKQGNKTAAVKGSENSSPAKAMLEENKENMDAPTMEEIVSTEVL